MKNIVKQIICIICVCCFVMLCSCGAAKLNGTYVIADESSAPWSFTVTKLVFQGSRVTVTDMMVQVKCSYELEDDQLIINGTTSLLGTEVAVNYDYEFEKQGNSIFLDGVEFVKK